MRLDEKSTKKINSRIYPFLFNIFFNFFLCWFYEIEFSLNSFIFFLDYKTE
jgi:hypothetical protein